MAPEPAAGVQELLSHMAAKTPPRYMPPRRTWLTFVVILVVNYAVARLLFQGAETAVTIPYTAFKAEAARGNIESIYSKGANIEGRFSKPVTWPPPSQRETPRGAERGWWPRPSTPHA